MLGFLKKLLGGGKSPSDAQEQPTGDVPCPSALESDSEPGPPPEPMTTAERKATDIRRPGGHIPSGDELSPKEARQDSVMLDADDPLMGRSSKPDLHWSERDLGADDEVEEIRRHAIEGMAKDFEVSSVDIMKAQGTQAMVDGKPTYEYAQTHKHDVDMMLECCRAEENVYWSHGSFKISPAPSYFERAAILSRKAKDYDGEVAICERWIAMAEDFRDWLSQNPKIGVADVTKGPVSKRIFNRLPKARALLEKQRENT
ncbi:hypothetical protein NPJ88_000540 [Halomonas elongata]|uniref:hypothetical protein n=1 Tax=Halomonas elongata TaxID=2746 RepID=UPI00255B3C60|nr:hypothetical protein [Halomonas elongata]MDL4860811.1 hypothetical protein [Halomonas elongata]